MLAIQHLKVSYGITQVLRDVTFEVPAGKIVALLGGNGSGKTTILNTLSGLVRCSGGSILFEGRECAGLSADSIVRRGIAQVPQGREVWPSMTVIDNLELGAATRRDWSAIKADVGEMFELFPKLVPHRRHLAGALSGGEQQMLAIGRALMSRPRLLLLDEPSLGLAPLIARQIFDAIRTLNRQDGLTVLIVEQNANHALKLAHRGYVMVNGLITLAGTGAELLQRPEIRAAYLEGGRHG